MHRVSPKVSGYKVEGTWALSKVWGAEHTNKQGPISTFAVSIMWQVFHLLVFFWDWPIRMCSASGSGYLSLSNSSTVQHQHTLQISQWLHFEARTQCGTGSGTFSWTPSTRRPAQETHWECMLIPDQSFSPRTYAARWGTHNLKHRTDRITLSGGWYSQPNGWWEWRRYPHKGQSSLGWGRRGTKAKHNSSSSRLWPMLKREILDLSG